MSLEILRKNFNQIRKNPETWDQFKFKDSETKLKRYAIAKELQYDVQESDYVFIKFLMEEEIKCRENDPFQGIGDCLLLLSYLLASYKKPENVLIFERAKLANFDTYLGYDQCFIFSAGIKETYDYLQKIELTKNNGYLFKNNDFIETDLKENDIDDFWEKVKNHYPKEIENEDITSRILTAKMLNEVKKQYVLYEELENTPNIHDETLAYNARLIGNNEKFIYYKNKLLKKAKDKDVKLNYLLEISEAYLNLNKPKDAYNILGMANDLLKQNDDFSGKMRITHNWFKVALELNKYDEFKLSKSAYTIADELLGKINPSCTLLEDAILVVNIHGTDKDKEKYKLKYEEEVARLNAL